MPLLQWLSPAGHKDCAMLRSLRAPSRAVKRGRGPELHESRTATISGGRRSQRGWNRYAYAMRPDVEAARLVEQTLLSNRLLPSVI